MLKDCLNSLLNDMPDAPLPFIQQFFGAPAAGAGEPPKSAGAVTMGSDTAMLQAQVGQGGALGLGGMVVDSSEEEEETETEEEEDELGDLTEIDFEEEERKKRERIGGRRRNSVSSETVRGDEVQKEFPVHAKDPEQEVRIFNILSQSILLKHLEAGPSQIITKAMVRTPIQHTDAHRIAWAAHTYTCQEWHLGILQASLARLLSSTKSTARVTS
jgi:hypothetical protein